MSFFRSSSAGVARRRLIDLVADDRAAVAGPDVLERLQAEFVAVIRRTLRGGRVCVRQGLSNRLQMLEIDIDLRPRARR
ncbi:Cell division topological specificity factor (plasmid) [Rhodovastum atsumiense]|uniref:cell division topological specificity factor MinE n=1 Tax=Rhodovastum atsumiense TaxID=504468 RepID=UPI002025AFD4|nr:cell division topological specificity factor MinE [Rhodovastum atsumiense]CAH2605466.1 Cell division topological specificity factor [Rhodovastum atsumiense]